jgi:hypothetical protein
MGERGPPPKRADKRRRHTKQEDKPDSVPVNGAVKPPPVNSDWHPIAKRWFKSLKDSGQSIYYEPSDWGMAYVLAESMSRDLNPQVVAVPESTGEPVFETVPMKGASLAAYLKGMTALLVSEADRRRAGVELTRKPEPSSEDQEQATVVNLNAVRNRAAG